MGAMSQREERESSCASEAARLLARGDGGRGDAPRA
jgi:hypothetical protein